MHAPCVTEYYNNTATFIQMLRQISKSNLFENADTLGEENAKCIKGLFCHLYEAGKSNLLFIRDIFLLLYKNNSPIVIVWL